MKIKQLNEELIAEEKVLEEYSDAMMEEFGQIPEGVVKGLIDIEMGRTFEIKSVEDLDRRVDECMRQRKEKRENK